MSDIAAVTYTNAVAVTKSDTVNDPAGQFAALQATTAAGVAQVTCIGGVGTSVTIYLPLGVIVPIAVLRVWSTTTSATGIIGLKARPVSNST